MIEQNDRECIRHCLQGDVEAFAILIDRYQRQMFNIAYGMTHNYEDAQDITQSVFIKVYEKLRLYKTKYKFFSWLYRITVNETLNFIKKNKQTEELNQEICSDEKSPLEAYEQTDRREYLHNALDTLSIDYKSVIVLKYFQQLSYTDIAYILDISEKKVKSRLFTARQKLRLLLNEKGYTPYEY